MNAVLQAQTAATESDSTVAAATNIVLQRSCACGGHAGVDGECTGCRRKRLQRSATQASAPAPEFAPPIVHEVLRSSGRPLDDNTRGFMESRFNQDFSHVRLHTDARAARSAREVNANAYTVGNNVVFAPGQYLPTRKSGQALLAHELAHVVHQRRAMVRLQSANDVTTRMFEADADRAASAVIHERPVQLRATGSSPVIQFQRDRRRSSPVTEEHVNEYDPRREILSLGAFGRRYPEVLRTFNELDIAVYELDEAVNDYSPRGTGFSDLQVRYLRAYRHWNDANALLDQFWSIARVMVAVRRAVQLLVVVTVIRQRQMVMTRPGLGATGFSLLNIPYRQVQSARNRASRALANRPETQRVHEAVSEEIEQIRVASEQRETRCGERNVPQARSLGEELNTATWSVEDIETEIRQIRIWLRTHRGAPEADELWLNLSQLQNALQEKRLNQVLRQFRNNYPPSFADNLTAIQIRQIIESLNDILVQRGFQFSDVANQQQVSSFLSENFSIDVARSYDTIIARHDAVLDNIRLRPQLNGQRSIGLFPTFGAIGEPVYRAGTNFGLLINALIEAAGQRLTEEDFQLLVRNLGNMSVVPFALHSFIAGTVVGMFQELRDFISILFNLEEFIEQMSSFVEIMISDNSSTAIALGRAIGLDLSGSVERLVREGTLEFSYEIGRLIGPTIVGIIIAMFFPQFVIGSVLRRTRRVVRFLFLRTRRGRRVLRRLRSLRRSPHLPQRLVVDGSSGAVIDATADQSRRAALRPPVSQVGHSSSMTHQEMLEVFTRSLRRPGPGHEVYNVYSSIDHYDDAWRAISGDLMGDVPQGFVSDGIIHLPPNANTLTVLHETLHWASNQSGARILLGEFLEEGLVESIARRIAGPEAGRVYEPNVRLAEELVQLVGRDTLENALLHRRWGTLRRALNGHFDSAEQTRIFYALLRRINAQGEPADVLQQARNMLHGLDTTSPRFLDTTPQLRVPSPRARPPSSRDGIPSGAQEILDDRASHMDIINESEARHFSGLTNRPLRQTLESQGRFSPNPNFEAHHIVPENLDVGLRDLLRINGIDINRHVNGAWVPRNNQVANQVGANLHAGDIHRSHISYVRTLRQRLMQFDGEPDLIINELQNIGREMEGSGRFFNPNASDVGIELNIARPRELRVPGIGRTWSARIFEIRQSIPNNRFESVNDLIERLNAQFPGRVRDSVIRAIRDNYRVDIYR